MQAQTRGATLSDAVLPGAGLLREVVLVVTFVLLTAAAARIAFYLPWNPVVPVTGQTLAVLLTGATLGSRRGAITIGVYVTSGALGLPFDLSDLHWERAFVEQPKSRARPEAGAAFDFSISEGFIDEWRQRHPVRVPGLFRA